MSTTPITPISTRPSMRSKMKLSATQNQWSFTLGVMALGGYNSLDLLRCSSSSNLSVSTRVHPSSRSIELITWSR